MSSTRLPRLGNTEFNLIFANFCTKYMPYDTGICQYIKKIKCIYTNWIYKTAGYYDKDIPDKEIYLYPDDFTNKLDSFIDNMGKVLFGFDEAGALPLSSFSKIDHPLHQYIPHFENYYKVKLFPRNIDARCGISLIKDKKRILVISPFKELIDKQIESGNLKILQPSLAAAEFIIYKFPYTFLNNGPHRDSIETLDIIKQDLINNYNDFDMAILSCGCYGIFLMDTICNTMNKDAAYIGGQLPLIFGIIGQRDKWALRELYNKQTDYVIDGVPEAYRPQGYEKIENGCYW